MRHIKTHGYSILLILFLIPGIGLRIYSYTWNIRLYGDVNLFALTARQVMLKGELTYPMKYGFSPDTLYLSLTTPASQHPPLWPLIGGIIAKAFSTQDTFSILKLLAEAVGLSLLGIIAFHRTPIANQPARISAFIFTAFSPWLVDYSANGSPFILAALLLWLSWIVQTRLEENISGRYPSLTSVGFAGFICGLGILSHSILILLPLAFILRIFLPGTKLSHPTRRQWVNLLIFLLVLFTVITPWMMWNYKTFGSFFYSSSTDYLLDKLGLLEITQNGSIITTQALPIPWGDVIPDYLRTFRKALYASCLELLSLMGPFTIILITSGIADQFLKLTKHTKNKFLSTIFKWIFSSYGLYILMMTLWAAYKFRFLIPLLPAAYWLAGMGFAYWVHLGGWKRWVAYICFVGGLLWMLPVYNQSAPNLYYGKETIQNSTLYDSMRACAEEMSSIPAGAILGYAQILDGGIETIYWHKKPFIAARGLDLSLVSKLVQDFNVRYIWTDEASVETLEKLFPQMKVRLENPPFILFEFK